MTLVNMAKANKIWLFPEAGMQTKYSSQLGVLDPAEKMSKFCAGIYVRFQLPNAPPDAGFSAMAAAAGASFLERNID